MHHTKQLSSNLYGQEYGPGASTKTSDFLRGPRPEPFT